MNMKLMGFKKGGHIRYSVSVLGVCVVLREAFTLSIEFIHTCILISLNK